MTSYDPSDPRLSAWMELTQVTARIWGENHNTNLVVVVVVVVVVVAVVVVVVVVVVDKSARRIATLVIGVADNNGCLQHRFTVKTASSYSREHRPNHKLPTRLRCMPPSLSGTL